ncbi:MAG: DNA alkylation repair protein [Bacilli bacterium]
MNYLEFKQSVYSKIDKEYYEFSSGLSNSGMKYLGVRVPVLKALVKKEKDDSELKVEDFEINDSHEILCAFMWLNLLRIKDYKEQFKFINKYISKCLSWAITDSLPQFISLDTPLYFYLKYFKKWCSSPDTYKRRFAYVFMMRFAKEKESLIYLDYIKNDNEYYVMMAEAWLMATSAIYYEDEIYNKLNSGILNKQLVQKTISKIVDSYRITNEIKNKFKSIRNKDY